MRKNTATGDSLRLSTDSEIVSALLDADGGLDFSTQALSSLNEAYPFLNEASGIGTDINSRQAAAHLTRWYSIPSALDQALQKASRGGRFATIHCDATPLAPNETPNAVLVAGSVAPGGTFSARSIGTITPSSAMQSIRAELT
jgi:hypothetical protein